MSRFLIDAMEDARQCTLTLIDGLDKDQLKGPMLDSPMIGVALHRSNAAIREVRPGLRPIGHTRVLRGGAWTTRGRMIRNTWRTYYGAERCVRGLSELCAVKAPDQ